MDLFRQRAGSLLANVRNPPSGAVEAFQQGAMALDASKRQVEQANSAKQAVNSMVSAVRQDQAVAGRMHLPLRRGFERINGEQEDRTIWGDWKPSDREPSFNETLGKVKHALRTGGLTERQFNSVQLLLSEARNANWEASRRLPRLFATGAMGVPRSAAWYLISKMECVAAHSLTFNTSIDPQQYAALVEPQIEEESREVASSVILAYGLRRGDKNLVRAGRWEMQIRNSGLAPVTYELELKRDGTLSGQVNIGGGATDLVKGTFQRVLNPLSMLDRQINSLLGSALAPSQVHGEWRYTPGVDRHLELNMLTIHSAMGSAVEGHSAFRLLILGRKQDQGAKGWQLQAQDVGAAGASTGEWLLSLLEMADDYATPTPRG